MNRQTLSRRIIPGAVGVFILLFGFLANNSWASHRDKLMIRGSIGDVNLMFVSQGYGRYYPREYYPNGYGYGYGRPVVTTTTTTTTTYQAYGWSPPPPAYGISAPYRSPRGHHHRPPGHCNVNRRGRW